MWAGRGEDMMVGKEGGGGGGERNGAWGRGEEGRGRDGGVDRW